MEGLRNIGGSRGVTYVALVDADGEAGLLHTLLRHVGGFDRRVMSVEGENSRQ